MNYKFFIRIGILSTLLLSACVSVSKKPDLERLYGRNDSQQNNNPIIIIPGLMGTTLVDDKGVEVWPKSVSNLAFSTFDDLVSGEASQSLKPGKLFDGIAGVDFYRTLIQVLETAGRYQKAEIKTPINGSNKRRYYVFLYDWRKSNFMAVNQLHELINQIRLDYNNPNLQVDIIAHSNGGMIARYYLQYGPQTELSRIQPRAWTEGSKRIHRLAMLGTPNLGSVSSIKRLLQGFRIGVKTVPIDVLAQLATPFEALPSPNTHVIVDSSGTAVDIDIYDIAVWKTNQWGVYSEEFVHRIQKELPDTVTAANKIQHVQAQFAEHLQQAKYFQSALSAQWINTATEIALFGGDCNDTLARAVLEKQGTRTTLAFSDSEIAVKQKDINYQDLLYMPGDGLVTRESQLARTARTPANIGLPYDLFPIAQTTFFCESHELLTGNPYFQNNLLYFLFH